MYARKYILLAKSSQANDQDSQDFASEKIREFNRFDTGWHMGMGKAFDQSTIHNAQRIVEFLNNYAFKVIDALPGLNGEIRILTYPEDYYFEITIEDDGQICFVVEDADDKEIIRQSTYSIDNLEELVLVAKTSLIKWPTSASLQYGIGNDTKDDLIVWHSGIRKTIREYLSSPQTVPIKFQVASAPTSPVSIQDFLTS
jgi:hypothetical protein